MNKSIVESRANSDNIDDDFEHLVAHAMSYTLESDAECAMWNEVLRFGFLDQVLNEDDLKGFDQGIIRGKAWSNSRQQALR